MQKLKKIRIFFIFGFDTWWKPAYKPQTRCYSAGEIVRHLKKRFIFYEDDRPACRKRCLKKLVCYERDSWAAMSVDVVLYKKSPP